MRLLGQWSYWENQYEIELTTRTLVELSRDCPPSVRDLIFVDIAW